VYRRVPATYPDDAFLNRGWFCKQIIIGLVVMTLLGVTARSSASGSDSSMPGVSWPPRIWYLGPLYSCP
jgi:hypothetical protein